jgi:Xaa-Pro aminopeptidase
MSWPAIIQDVQSHLVKGKINGWLLYDFQCINPLARKFLQIPPEELTTRRFFYWIPARGEPVKILHRIEPHVLSHLPGKECFYLAWQQLHEQLKTTLQGVKTLAMEYSPNQAIPTLSKVDGGLIDLIRSFSIEVVSSATFLQYYTCVLDEEQLQLHEEAAIFLDHVVAQAWDKIRAALVAKQSINEYQVRMFIAEQMEKNGFTTEALPICAVNAHSADPHFEPTEKNAAVIKRGDFILIDLWCKKNHPKAIYGDITRVGVADRAPTEKQQQIFSLVRAAQVAATKYVQTRYAAKQPLKGYEVDRVCRGVIEKGGFGPYFLHRTGHNIYTQDHGPGANIDSLETVDERELIPHTCFSIEPGIYLPGEFGVRLEYDVYLGDGGVAKVTGGSQESILCLY